MHMIKPTTERTTGKQKMTLLGDGTYDAQYCMEIRRCICSAAVKARKMRSADLWTVSYGHALKLANMCSNPYKRRF